MEQKAGVVSSISASVQYIDVPILRDCGLADRRAELGLWTSA